MSHVIPPQRLDQALSDIERHINDPEDQQNALRQLRSIRDYTPGDERTCTWQAALENCEQIKGYFPASTPESCLENIDAIANEIRTLEKARTPLLFRILTNRYLLLLLGVLVVLLFLLMQR